MTIDHHPKHIVAVTGLIRDAKFRVLMLLSPLRGWECPGGQVEEGESLIAALRREISEETGISAIVGPLVGIYSNVKPPPKLLFSFLGDFESGDLKTSSESTALGWIKPDEVLGQIAHPAIHDRVKDMLAFSGRVIYRVYSTDPYTILDERYLDGRS